MNLAARELAPGTPIYKFIFKVDGGLRADYKSHDEKTAKAGVERYWPRSTIVLESAEFSHNVGDFGVAVSFEEKSLPRPIGRDRHIFTAKTTPKSVEESMADTIGASFAGA